MLWSNFLSRACPVILLAILIAGYHLICPWQEEALFCNKACIFDIGLSTGQDSALYLSQGYRVLSVDASPTMIGRAAARFAKEVIDGRSKLLCVGIERAELVGDGARELGPSLTFWVHPNNVYSSFEKKLGCRAGSGANTSACHPIAVPTISCANLIRRYGTPVFMKIDIEGRDHACVDSLLRLPMQALPAYLSVENVNRQTIEVMQRIGYKKFKVVDQRSLQKKFYIGTRSNDHGGSGPWGEMAEDIVSGTTWRTADDVLSQKIALSDADGVIWYDLHAKRGT